MKHKILIWIFVMCLLVGSVSSLDEDYLIAWWDFEDTCQDAQNKFIVSSATIDYNSSGKVGKSGLFNGSVNCVMQSNTIIKESMKYEGEFSVSYWIKNKVENSKLAYIFVDYTTHGGIYIPKPSYAGAQVGYETPDGSVNVVDWNWTNQRYFTYDTWTHIVFINPNTDDGKCGYYVNGVWDGIQSGDVCKNISNAGIALTTTIGSAIGGASGYIGELDSLNIWNKTLNSSDVLELYNLGYGINYTEAFPSTICSVPNITFNKLYSPSLIEYNLNNNTNYQYESGTWTFNINVQESNPDTINLKWYCQNGTLLREVTDNYNLSDNFTATTFQLNPLLCNPLKLEVYANNTCAGSSNESIIFRLLDTIKPSCDFKTEYQQENLTTLTFNVECLDESLHNLSVNCGYNNYSFFVENISSTSYIYNDSIINAEWDTCFAESCDEFGNCNDYKFFISDLNLQDKPQKEFTSVSQALYWFLMIGIWILAVIGTIVLKGIHGETIQLLNISQMILGSIVGLGFMEFHFAIGFLIVLFACGLCLGKAIEN